MLVYRSEYAIKILRRAYLPSPHSQPQSTRCDWEILFHFARRTHSDRIIENRNTGKFGNSFFEQLQSFTA